MSLVSDIFEPSGAEVISRTPVTSAQGLAAEILELELLGGQGRVKRFVMMTNDHVAFSASFVTLGLVYYELEPMIDYSFSTFRLEEAGYSP